jgi:hypothetical protein
VVVNVDDPVAVLDLLTADGVCVDSIGGRLIFHPIPPAWVLLCTRGTLQLVAAVIRGELTGHHFCRCPECGQGLMLKDGKNPRSCVMTPGCDGKVPRFRP